MTVAHGEARQSARSGRIVLDIVATVAMIAASVGVIWVIVWPNLSPQPRPSDQTQPPSIAAPSDPVSFAGAPSLGRAEAQVALIEFSDFTCPHCARFATETLPTIKAMYIDSGQLLFAYRHYPVAADRARAERAALTADCASKQGRFWSMHDALFQDALRAASLSFDDLSRAAGADSAALQSCVTNAGSNSIVTTDRAEAIRIGLTGTPAFLLGEVIDGDAIRVTDVIAGALPTSEFVARIGRVVQASR